MSRESIIEQGRKRLIVFLGIVVLLPLLDLMLRPSVPTFGPTALPDLQDPWNTGMGPALLVPYLAWLTYASRFRGARAVLVIGLVLRAGSLIVALALLAGTTEASGGITLLLGTAAGLSLTCAAALMWHPAIRAYLTWVREPRNVFERL